MQCGAGVGEKDKVSAFKAECARVCRPLLPKLTIEVVG